MSWGFFRTVKHLRERLQEAGRCYEKAIEKNHKVTKKDAKISIETKCAYDELRQIAEEVNTRLERSLRDR